MKSVVVFAGRSGVDFSEVRASVLRIPEVSIKIRQAQKAIDQLGHAEIDLLAIANAEDSVINQHSSVKIILSSLVQLALFERSLRSQRKPNYLMASTKELGVLDLIKGETISSFVQKALAGDANQTTAAKNSGSLASAGVSASASVGEAAPLLASNVIAINAEASADEGFSILEVNINEAGTLKGINEVLKGSEAKTLFTDLIEKMNVTKFVNIGPSNALANSNDETLESVTVIDSIEADPMLNWFWQGLRPVANSYAV